MRNSGQNTKSYNKETNRNFATSKYSSRDEEIIWWAHQ